MQDFTAARWLPGRHAQTVGARVLRPRGGVSFRRERLDLPDGDFVDLDFADVDGQAWSQLPATSPIVVVLHGLEGSARAKYAIQLYRHLAAAGVRALGLNFRSCSGEPNRTTRLYHSGDTADARLVLEQLRARFPDVPLGAIGISLGGNVLLKLLGEDGSACPIQAAATISVPYDLAACSVALEGSGGHPYGRYLLRSLVRKITARKAEFAPVVPDIDAAVTASTIRAFDEHITAPVFGFASAQDYYERCSSAAFLHRVQRRTLLISAFDDPFVPGASVPQAQIADNPLLTLRLSAHGGHVGFVGGWPWRRDFWAERTAATFVAQALVL